MPFLDREASLEAIVGRKYICTPDGRIYYRDDKDNAQFTHHDDLAAKAGVIIQPGIEPVVMGAGEIYNIDGKFSFSIKTTTCKIKDPNNAFKLVRKAAAKILGEERVA